MIACVAPKTLYESPSAPAAYCTVATAKVLLFVSVSTPLRLSRKSYCPLDEYRTTPRPSFIRYYSIIIAHEPAFWHVWSGDDAA